MVGRVHPATHTLVRKEQSLALEKRKGCVVLYGQIYTRSIVSDILRSSQKVKNHGISN